MFRLIAGALALSVLSGCACRIDGDWVLIGKSVSDGCNTCTCGVFGSYGCTEMACVEGCTDAEGQFHLEGEMWQEDCNACVCSGGEVACDDQACDSGAP